MMAKLDVQVGDELPAFERLTGFAEWNRYAAVNDEFVPIHMDDEEGRQAGFPGAIGMGFLQVAYLHNLVRDWLDDRGRIVAFGCRFNAPNLRNHVVSAKGRVVQVSDHVDGVEAVLEIWTADDSGNRLAPGTCTVVIDG
jgi:acyl dehydratase